MAKRQKNLHRILRWWQQGNINSCINTMSQMNDPSVINDFMSVTFVSDKRSLNLLTFENGGAILNHCLSLLNSKYEAYHVTGL